MKEFIEKLSKAKADIDAGMCRIGPRLDAKRPEEAFLTGGASRAIVLADAAVQLCHRDHTAEAAPLMRYLLETAVTLRWVAAASGEDAAKRAIRVLAELEAADWGHLWSDETIKKRAAEAGVPLPEVDAVLRLAVDFSRSGRMILPWSHAFSENQYEAPSGDRILRIAASMMGHVTAGLEQRWPGIFPGAEQLWS